jgi:hypothetical protein
MHLVMLVMVLVMVMMKSVYKLTAIILWKGGNADRLNG